MMQGKKFWMASAALVALTAAANASEPANGTVITNSASIADSAVQLAQNSGYLQLAQNTVGTSANSGGSLDDRV